MAGPAVGRSHTGRPGETASVGYTCRRSDRCGRGRGFDSRRLQRFARGPHRARIASLHGGNSRFPPCAPFPKRRSPTNGRVPRPPCRSRRRDVKTQDLTPNLSNTVLRALRMLRDEGLVEFRRGRGITVAGTPERVAVVQRAKELVDFARRQGYRLDELVEIIEDVGQRRLGARECSDYSHTRLDSRRVSSNVADRPHAPVRAATDIPKNQPSTR
jgi:hypothetical protein